MHQVQAAPRADRLLGGEGERRLDLLGADPDHDDGGAGGDGCALGHGVLLGGAARWARASTLRRREPTTKGRWARGPAAKGPAAAERSRRCWR